MRHETKKMGRQDARKKNWEMRCKTNKKLGDKMRDQNKWGRMTRSSLVYVTLCNYDSV